jgi:imidazolonepropionase-like amidohydrolase
VRYNSLECRWEGRKGWYDVTHRFPALIAAPPMLTGLAWHNLEQGAATMRAARLAGVPIALGSDVSLATGQALSSQALSSLGS